MFSRLTAWFPSGAIYPNRIHYGPVISVNRPVRIRMPLDMGAGGGKLRLPDSIVFSGHHIHTPEGIRTDLTPFLSSPKEVNTIDTLPLPNPALVRSLPGVSVRILPLDHSGADNRHPLFIGVND